MPKVRFLKGNRCRRPEGKVEEVEQVLAERWTGLGWAEYVEDPPEAAGSGSTESPGKQEQEQSGSETSSPDSGGKPPKVETGDVKEDETEKTVVTTPAPGRKPGRKPGPKPGKGKAAAKS